MLRTVIAPVAMLAIAAACTGTTATGTDDVLPAVTLTLLNNTGTPSFRSSPDGDWIISGFCGTARSFPATFSVSASDAGGIDTVTVRISPANLVAGSVTATPTAAAGIAVAAGDPETLTLTIDHPAGAAVYVSTIMLAKVDGPTPINLRVSATDLGGNENTIMPVDIRAIGEEYVGSGSSQYNCVTGGGVDVIVPDA
jgi:hypothetical protein